jgi:hypothetical protein
VRQLKKGLSEPRIVASGKEIPYKIAKKGQTMRVFQRQARTIIVFSRTQNRHQFTL